MTGPRLYSMAWRNLWRNRRRTLITLSALVFGVFLAIIFTGMTNRSLSDGINYAARFGAGHVTFQHSEYLDTPSTRRTVEHVDQLEALAHSVPGVKHVYHRVVGQLMLATAGQSQGAQFLAYDPHLEDEGTLPLLEAVKPEERLKESTGQGIVLGAGLAENLGVTLGRKVVYTLTDRNGEIVTGLARVSGILKTNAKSVDGGMCLLPIDTIRSALGYSKDEATFVALYLEDHRQSERVAAELAKKVPEHVSALTWKEVQPDLAAFIGVKNGGLVIMELFMLVLTAAGIFNTLFVSVMERLREFGILMAIGFSPGRLFRLVVWESFWLGLTGVITGLLFTAYPYYLLAKYGLDVVQNKGQPAVEVAGVGFSTKLYAQIYPQSAVAIVLVILGATILSGLYPAWRAGRVHPVNSIKLV